MVSEGFELWKQALVLDARILLNDSKLKFEHAARSFFNEASNKPDVSRAFYEYSTLMDSFATVQDGRMFKSLSQFDKALDSFSRASEIMRATIHFGFMASYVSGCASLETAPDLEDDDEKFQGYKNSIALFEQSKIALSFRDERHPLIRPIDAIVKLAISRALLLESEILAKKGSIADSRKKREQSKTVEQDFRGLAGSEKKTPLSRFRINYFLKGHDCERAASSSYIMSFPEKTSLLIENVGAHPAQLETLGKSTIGKEIAPFGSITWPMEEHFRGRLRISYVDEKTKKRYDEGCLTVI